MATYPTYPNRLPHNSNYAMSSSGTVTVSHTNQPQQPYRQATDDPAKYAIGDRVEIRRGKLKGRIGVIRRIEVAEDYTTAGWVKKEQLGLQTLTYWAYMLEVDGVAEFVDLREGSISEVTAVSDEDIEDATAALLATLKVLNV